MKASLSFLNRMHVSVPKQSGPAPQEGTGPGGGLTASPPRKETSKDGDKALELNRRKEVQLASAGTDQ